MTATNAIRTNENERKAAGIAETPRTALPVRSANELEPRCPHQHWLIEGSRSNTAQPLRWTTFPLS
jgi:hypothetical protein